jgi:hypothetical protein
MQITVEHSIRRRSTTSQPNLVPPVKADAANLSCKVPSSSEPHNSPRALNQTITPESSLKVEELSLHCETIWTGSWNQTSTWTCMWASNPYCRYYYCSHYKHNIKHKKTAKPKPLRTATGKAKCLPYNSHTSPIIEDSILWRQTSVPDFYTKEKWYRNLGCWNLFKRSYSAFLLFDYFDYLSAP